MEENIDDNSKEIKEETKKSSERIVDRKVEEEMKQSYLDYAMSVIVGRALPDARDGLKPVHRRILYTMWESSLFHNKPFRKSANVVGNCMAKFHPHGDAAIYDTLVRMAQDFSLRYPLVQGQGNFGSLDGDAAAAMRYSEARLSKISEPMLHDIDKETVKFIPNFDNSTKEPSVLPSKIPNLLINGSSGIAVGMATNIPPHNIIEICDGIIAQIKNPEMSISELMQHVRGPDFPTGAIICGNIGIKHAYETGRSKIVVRAKVSVEEAKGRRCIIINEIPYMVNKKEMIEEIAELVNSKKIDGIYDIRDESDREGIRVVIELKKESNENVVLNQLYKHTRIQTTFGIIMLALVNNEPKVLNLKQIIKCYIDHRKNVVRKRTEFDLKKAQEREHILEGLIIALGNIDDVIKSIRESDSVENAKDRLIKLFKLSEKQSLAVLDMKLQKLAHLEQDNIKKELAELKRSIEYFKSIHASEQKLLEIIISEVNEIKEKYGDERRTEISLEEMRSIEIADLVKHQEMVITITHSGYIKTQPLSTYRQQKRGGKGIIGAGTTEEDFVEDIFISDSHSYILFFTNKGKVHWQKVYHIPEASRQARGKAIVNLLGLEKDEKVTAFIPVPKFDDQHYLIMATKKGIAKKTNLNAYSNPRKGGIIAITIGQDDELVGVVLTDGNKEIILATKNGNAVRFNEKTVRAAGRSAQGVRGARLRENDEIISQVIASNELSLLTVTENGYGKRTMVNEYRLTNRGSIGVRNIICSERNGKVVSVKSVTDNDEVMLISQHGIIIRIPAKGISVIGRSTQGMRLMKLEQNDKVVAAAKIVKE